MDPVEITAGRWHLRPWLPHDVRDVEAAAGLRQGPSTSGRSGTFPYGGAQAAADPTAAAAGWADGSAASWAVCDSTTGEPLGAVALHRRRPSGSEWDASVTTAPAARGRGLAPEALATAARWAFAELGAERLEAGVPVGWWAARRAVEKAGFRVEGVRRGQAGGSWVAARLAGDPDADTRALPAYPPVGDGVVLLRPWRAADAPEVARACADAETARWLPVPVPYTPEAARSYVEELVPHQWADGDAANVAVTDARTGELVGAVGLKLELRAYGVGEVGYWTAPWARGRGVAGRAARLHAEWGHDALGLGRVELLADVGNTPSQRAAERGGFVREGVLRAARPRVRAEGRADLVLFASVR